MTRHMTRLTALASLTTVALALGACSATLTGSGSGDPQPSSSASSTSAASESESSSEGASVSANQSGASVKTPVGNVEAGKDGATVEIPGIGKVEAGKDGAKVEVEVDTDGDGKPDKTSVEANGGSSTVESNANNGQAVTNDGSSAGNAAGGEPAVDLSDFDPELTLDAESAGGVIVIDKPNTDARVTGKVNSLTITPGAANATIYADDVENLVIESANADVHANSLSKVTVNAANATVTWSGKTPQIINNGANGTFRPAQ